MLSNDVVQFYDSRLLVIFDVTVKEFEALCGSKIHESDGHTVSEWEDVEN